MMYCIAAIVSQQGIEECELGGLLYRGGTSMHTPAADVGGGTTKQDVPWALRNRSKLTLYG